MSTLGERQTLLGGEYAQKSSEVNAGYGSVENENDDEIERVPKFVHMDGGYGWLVCVATFWCFGVIIGMDYNYSLIYNKLVVVYNGTENHVVYAG
jgi:hypothetical protein